MKLLDDVLRITFCYLPRPDPFYAFITQPPLTQDFDIIASILGSLKTFISVFILKSILSTIETMMERPLPAAPPPSPALSSDSEAVSIINHRTEERDEQTYRDLCDSRIDLLEKHYHVFKDTLCKAMGIADMWWGANDVNNLELQAKLGTRLIEDIIQPYHARTQALINRHTARFGVDDSVRAYLNICTNSVMNCFTSASRLDHNQAYTAKGLAVRAAEMARIRKFLSHIRKDYGRKILLEKGVRDYGYAHILKEPEEDPGVRTWSLLWAASTKPEDVKLWSIVPRGDLQKHKLDAFQLIKDERIRLLEEKIDTAQDFWDIKLDLVNDEDAPLEADDEEWAEQFESSSAADFEASVEGTKLRLMKEFNIFNFRFLGPLTDNVTFEEYLYLGDLQGLQRRDWPVLVQYRMLLLQVDKARVESLQFVDMDDADE